MLSDMDDDPVDVDFLAWAKANALPNDREAWARALGNSKQQSRRRLIRTEFSHKWISTCVATLMERYGCKKDPGGRPGDNRIPCRRAHRLERAVTICI
jgi:hypothetical protein